MIIKLSDEGCFSGRRKDKEGKYQRPIREGNHQGARPPILPISRKAGVQDYKLHKGRNKIGFSARVAILYIACNGKLINLKVCSEFIGNTTTPTLKRERSKAVDGSRAQTSFSLQKIISRLSLCDIKKQEVTSRGYQTHHSDSQKGLGWRPCPRNED